MINSIGKLILHPCHQNGEMNKIFLFFFTTHILFLPLILCAQNGWKGYEHLATPVKRYVVYQTYRPVLIDGNASEPDWAKVAWTTEFKDIEGNNKPLPLYGTRIKMLHDNSALYILAELEEPNIWATYDRHDMIIYHENDIEVFIDPDGDTHAYFEYELNALNTLLDLKMPMPYRDGGKADISWNSNGFKSAILLDGTLNNPSDTDKKWTVEIKIPFVDLQVNAPHDGQIWKVNFSRVEWRIQAIDGKYQKVKDPSTQRTYPEFNWVWSPPGLINMHYPERWGMVQFSEKEAGRETVDFKMPKEETVGKQLWLVYYKQQDFKRKNGSYASTLKELEIQSTDSPDIKMVVKDKDLRFIVQANLKDGSVLTLNEKGLFRKYQNQ